jgi:glutaminyl-tRNA synthetase
VVKCTGADRDAAGNVVAVHCEYYPDSKSGSAGADKYKVKGNIHWVCASSAYRAEVRLYDRLFRVPHPGAGDRGFVDDINPDSKRILSACLAALKDTRARIVSSSNGTATSWPIARIRSPERRYSTVR